MPLGAVPLAGPGMLERVTSRPDVDWSNVDALLFDGRRIEALAATRELLDAGLADAIPALGSRWESLLAEQGGRFTVPVEGYWDGFYT